MTRLDLSNLTEVKPTTVRLFGPAGWLGPIQLPPSASDETAGLAADLGDVLAQATGAGVGVVTGRAGPGILLGTLDEWSPDYGFPVKPIPAYLAEGHEYVIVTRLQCLCLYGRDAEGLERGVWRLASLLGYRLLMPTPGWEVVPRHADITVRLALGETAPLEFVQGLGNSGGIMDDSAERYDRWARRNGLYHRRGYRCGHAWGQIIDANRAEIDATPGLVAGQGKLCVFEPRVQEMATDFAKSAIRANQDLAMTTMSASDGSGWEAVCETHEQATNNPTDRTFALAGAVQDALDADPECRGVRVGAMAYGAASVDPGIPLNPRVVAVVPDGYIAGDRPWDDVAAGLRAAGTSDIVPYSFLGVWKWSRGLPGKGRACQLDALAVVAQRAHANTGTMRGVFTEACSSWAQWGPGYWVMGRMLSDRTVTDSKALYDEFVTTAFGDASEPVGRFYACIVTGDSQPLSSALIATMYAALGEAMGVATDAAVRGRIVDLMVYTRYLELMRAWHPLGTGGGLMVTTATLAAFEALIRHLWRSRDRDLLGYRTSYYDQLWGPWYEALEALYPGSTLTPFSTKPWPDEPFTEAEALGWLP